MRDPAGWRPWTLRAIHTINTISPPTMAKITAAGKITNHSQAAALSKPLTVCVLPLIEPGTPVRPTELVQLVTLSRPKLHPTVEHGGRAGWAVVLTGPVFRACGARWARRVLGIAKPGTVRRNKPL